MTQSQKIPSVNSLAKSIFLLLLGAAATFAIHAAVSTHAQATTTKTAIDPNLIVARPCPTQSCLFTWTLTTRLGHALNFAEQRYGQRDRDWTVLGIEFSEQEKPQNWYPDFGGSGKDIVIQLTEAAASNEHDALFQLAHEVVHLLSPVGPGNKATVLEEGLAVFNSLEYLQHVGLPAKREYISQANYRRAYDSIRELAREQSDFVERVRDLRQQHKSLSALSIADVGEAFPAISADLAQRLAKEFK